MHFHIWMGRHREREREIHYFRMLPIRPRSYSINVYMVASVTRRCCKSATSTRPKTQPGLASQPSLFQNQRKSKYNLETLQWTFTPIPIYSNANPMKPRENTTRVQRTYNETQRGPQIIQFESHSNPRKLQQPSPRINDISKQKRNVGIQRRIFEHWRSCN